MPIYMMLMIKRLQQLKQLMAIRKAIVSFCKRLRSCISTKGRHFKLLYWYCNTVSCTYFYRLLCYSFSDRLLVFLLHSERVVCLK